MVVPYGFNRPSLFRGLEGNNPGEKKNSTLDALAKEFNPLRDFENIQFYKHVGDRSLEEKMHAQLKNLSFFLTLVKPITRGSIIGATVGAIASLADSSSMGENVYNATVLFALLDCKQYMLRGMYHYLKKQFE
ncbi:hypothetical protein KA107_03390 [Candidatus Pacearchaeota archaeon]|nr:hypothetical protein [Candidatus Pacearchaeota archaeon]